ncbi:hypothetical protein UCRPC4_g04229 [Phaeomoniella chlamydospora]|uniref:Uncharacterized protein n=1 Tax=Phaeomoniella chlamydospora TaxID=158046 RepID=A0A0G2GTH4_PHACM|nr:hypothetical protein UCRPC4_g04229 [Phaeomoniella chlamydospora]
MDNETYAKLYDALFIKLGSIFLTVLRKNTLDNLDIDVSQLTLDPSASDFNNLFFKPYKYENTKGIEINEFTRCPKLVKKPDPLDAEYWESMLMARYFFEIIYYGRSINPEDEYPKYYPSPLSFTRWKPSGSCHPGREIDHITEGPNEEEWRFDDLYDTQDPDLPHLMITTYHGYEGAKDEILTGDVIAILDCMLRRLGKRPQHLICPVLLISFCGNRYARIIQAHGDPESLRLKLKCSEKLPLHSRKTNKLNFRAVFLWMMNTPIGTTSPISASTVAKTKLAGRPSKVDKDKVVAKEKTPTKPKAESQDIKAKPSDKTKPSDKKVVVRPRKH